MSAQTPQEKPALYLQAFKSHVDSNPNAPSLHWLNNQLDVEEALTRGQLWGAALPVAYRLLNRKDLSRGDRVMLVFPPGIQFMIGMIACLQAGMVAVSVYPPNPRALNKDLAILQGMAENCQAKVVLTNSSFNQMRKLTSLTHSWPKGLKWNTLENSKLSKQLRDSSTTWLAAAPARSDPAIIQYTSGSTGDPKGIVISHGALAHQCDLHRSCILQYFEDDANSTDLRYVGWAPQYHDMGLFAGYMVPVYIGSQAFNFSPLDFIRKPILWPQAIAKYHGSVTGGPNFAYELACKRLQDVNEQGQCSTLRVALSGAEPANIKTLDFVPKCFGMPSTAYIQAYGLAEHVVLVSCPEPSLTKQIFENLWSVGNVALMERLGDVVIRVVVSPSQRHSSDEKTEEIAEPPREANPGEHGEIWVSSDSVASGYWNRPELSRQAFENKLPSFPNRTFLRTGDSGVIQDGNLFVTSRIKDLIILHGRNYAPADIERSAEAVLPQVIRPGSTVAFQDGPEKVILICEFRRGVSPERPVVLLARDVQAAVEKDMVIPIYSVVMVPFNSVPKTTSGKIKRSKTKELWKTGKLKAVGAVDGEDTATTLRNSRTLRELLQTAGVSDWSLTLPENGIDSMRLAEVVNTAEKKFSIRIDYAQAMSLSVRDLVDALEGEEASGNDSTEFTITLPPENFEMEASIPSKGSRLVLQCLSFAYVVMLPVIAAIPPAFFVDALWEDNQWWIIHGRSGPLTLLSIPLWACIFTLLCIVTKWVFLGRQRAGFLVFWSPSFAAWWTVTKVWALWNGFVGRFLVKTPWLTLIYMLSGVSTHLSTRFDVLLSDSFDLVSVGKGTIVKGQLVPHFFQFPGVHFGQVRIGDGVTVLSRSIVQGNTQIADGITLRRGTGVLWGTCLEEPDTEWEGATCKRVDTFSQKIGTTGSNSGPAVLTRVLFPLLFIIFALACSACSNLILPESTPLARSETWTWTSFSLVSGTYLAMVGLTGLFLFLFTVVLKWSGLSSFLTDRFAEQVFQSFFPFIERTFLVNWWHRAFGMKIARSSFITSTQACSASTAHHASVGEHIFLPPGCELDAERPIYLPKGVELGFGTYVGPGTRFQDGAKGCAACTILPADTKIGKDQRAIGNPLLPLATEIGTGSDTVAAAKSSSSLPYYIHVGLALAHFSWLVGCVWVGIEGLRALPIYDMQLSWKVMLAFLYAFAVALLVPSLEFVLYKIVAGSRLSAERETPMFSAESSISYHYQTLKMTWTPLCKPLISGYVFMNLWIKLMGFSVDLWSSFVDDDLSFDDATLSFHIGKWTVLDNLSCTIAHLADRGLVRSASVKLGDHVVVHPGAFLAMTSVGMGTHILPLARTLGEVPMDSDQAWAGFPAQPLTIARPEYCSPGTPSFSGSSSSDKRKSDVDGPQHQVDLV